MKCFQLRLKADPTLTIKIQANYYVQPYDYFKFIANNETVAIIPTACLASMEVSEIEMD